MAEICTVLRARRETSGYPALESAPLPGSTVTADRFAA
jgi:hypothetical protein